MANHSGYLTESWCGLTWSIWVPFGSSNFKEIPVDPGLYRVKAINQNFLTYIGQTGSGLRNRLRALITHTHKDSMPFNDPHTAAPSHWAWRKTHNFEFECSAAVFPFPKRQRLGHEHYLLWQYRLEYGESPLCNLGRYHSNYSRPSNRKEGRLGRVLPEDVINISRFKSIPPLQLKGEPFDKDWMGLNWINAHKNKISGPGIYKILDLDKSQVIYIGQSINIDIRLGTHRRKNWGVEKISMSVVELPKSILPHQRLELENDLLGAYYYLYQGLPKINCKE